jgi:hypothetical protein
MEKIIIKQVSVAMKWNEMQEWSVITNIMSIMRW